MADIADDCFRVTGLMHTLRRSALIFVPNIPHEFFFNRDPEVSSDK
jgi:hypothetical protein